MFKIGEKLRDPKIIGAIIEEWMKDKPRFLIEFLRNRKVLKLIYYFLLFFHGLVFLLHISPS